MKLKIMGGLLGVVLICLSLVVIYTYAPGLFSKTVVMVPGNPGCRLDVQDCSVDLPNGGRVVVSMSPRPVPLAAPLRIELVVEQMELIGAEVSFTGVVMDMGPNRVRLASRDARHFSAETVLPVCITGGMEWEARLSLETPQEQIVVPFRFDSGA